ncbi:MAG: response regulator transcription factor [Anaerolineae bacterium]|nr:response regulator transcription factor [Anaerolineae bacterium]
MSTIKILLAEDHQVVREGTRQLLEQEADFTVVGEASNGETAMQLAQELRPDVVLMDVHMPKVNGLEATKRIKATASGIRVLILSAYEDDHYIFPLLEAGADGYLLKTTSGAELIRSIRAVYRGETVLDPQVTSKVVSQITKKKSYQSTAMVESLTEREIEVLQAVASGKSNKEVAEELYISPYTVQVHLRNIFGKLGVNSRTEAVTYALREGWIKLDTG